jgi:hypothetical protein
VTAPAPYWGPRTGKKCAGCHNISPDGRYLAVTELGTFKMIDTQSDIAIPLPSQYHVNFLSFKPDITTTPIYEFAYDDGSDIHLASIFGGEIGKLPGADTSTYLEMMPTWGSSGMIAFARGTMTAGNNNSSSDPNNGGGWGLTGPSDVMLIPEAGGTAVPLNGASGNGFGNYYPSFSPNGKWIAFTQSQSAGSTIGAMDSTLVLAPADNSGSISQLPRMNAPGIACSFPTWAVDGTFLSFSSLDRPGGSGDWDIWYAPIDPNTGADGPPMPLSQANTPKFEHAAHWSP